MNKFVKLLMACGIMLCSTACGVHLEEGEEFWGKEVGFSSNWMWQYTPDTLWQTLVFEPNEDEFERDLSLAIYYINPKTGKTEKLPMTMELYANGGRCADSKFVVHAGQEEVKLGLVLLESIESGTYQMALKVLDPGDLDEINNQQTNADMDALIEWKVCRSTRMNPANEILMITGIVIASLLALWLCVLQFIFFPRFSFSDLNVFFFDEGSRKGGDSRTIKRARKVVLTNMAKKQSALSRIFTGKVIYIENRFVVNNIELTSAGSQGLYIKEIVELGQTPAYRLVGGMVSSVNGPKRPYVVKVQRSMKEIHLSIC